MIHVPNPTNHCTSTWRFFHAFLLAIAVIFCGSYSVSAQISVPLHAWKISKNIEKFHYQPKVLDDDFSLLVCENVLDLLDPNGLYFSEEDVLELRVKSKSIQQDIPNQKTVFLDFLTEKFQTRLTYVEDLLKSYDAKKIVFSNEQLILSSAHPFALQKDFDSKWEKILKARILRVYFSESDSVEILQAPNSTQIEEFKTQIISNEKKRIENKSKQKGGLKQKVGEMYLKSIANAYDPHTDYFTLTDEEEFSNYLSKEIQAFGFTLEMNESGEFEIVEITPGSSAWKSNELNEEDILLKAKVKNKLFVFENKTSEEVATFLSNEKMDEAHFWVRKKNGEEVELDLSKEALEVEENLIESFILDGKEKIGYVYLPSFYSKGDGSRSYATGCANDVAKELIHLQKEGVKGLVFDLRSNGGGSMLEAILLAGIFVDYGALSIYGQKGGDLETLKDINKGILFDKPMVVLIDQFSASASELFSAAMQDHHRALIAGSNSYGKSTAQTVLPIDAYEMSDLGVKPSGNPEAYVKITGGAFYRVTGQTHQSKGIEPDIYLPNYYEHGEIGEKYERGALILPPVEKKTYYTPWPEFPTQLLKTKSADRIARNLRFIEIEKESKVYAAELQEFKILLSFDLYKADWITDHEESQELATNEFKVRNPNYIQGTDQVHIGSAEMNEFAIQNIQEDLYIEEAYQILNDLIQTQNK